jgi:ABC-2 type transport system ATP-binding protein
VSVEGLVHRYGDREALNGVSFDVAEGELFGLLGPNGGGKTTLFRIVTTLMPPTSGAAHVFGSDVVQHPASVRRRLGVVFQQPALDAELTVKENLRFHGALVGLRGRLLDERIDALLGTFGLIDRAGDRVRTLSGGLARRTDLVRGLLHSPDLLLLDEPSTGLDPLARRDLWSALARLRHDEGTTILVATHLMEEAERCDRVGILDAGRLVGLGAPQDLRAELADEALWLETDRPGELRELLADRLALVATIVGDALLVETDDAPAALGRVLAAFPGMVRAATVRRPTLDDVFASRTGARIEAGAITSRPAVRA